MLIEGRLQKFLIIYEESSLSKAADRLDINQGALSRALAALENELGYDLFIRTNRGLIRSPEANKLYQHLQNHLKSWDLYCRTDTDGETSGELRLAGHSSVIEPFAKSIGTWLKQNPRIGLEVLNLRSPEALRKILNHDADVGLIVNPKAYDELVIQKLYTENVYVFHQGEVNEHTPVYFNPEIISASQLQKSLKDNRLITVHSYELAARLAKTSGAAAVLPEALAKLHGLKNHQKKSLLTAHISLVYRADRKKDRALQSFRQRILDLNSSRR